MSQRQELQRKVEQQSRRMQRAERERPTLLANTVYLGTLGLVFVLPVVGCAYLGHWLDSLAPGYSFRWTLNLLLLGVAIGGMNVYLMIRE
jgi:ATP synthase protein I